MHNTQSAPRARRVPWQNEDWSLLTSKPSISVLPTVMSSYHALTLALSHVGRMIVVHELDVGHCE